MQSILFYSLHVVLYKQLKYSILYMLKDTFRMKKIIITLVLVFILGAGFWYFVLPNLNTNGPSNLPTVEERQRMEAIEESSSKIAPNAVPGAGVRPVGSLPKTPEPSPVSTSTASSSEVTSSTTPESSGGIEQ